MNKPLCPIIVALDVDRQTDALQWVDKFSEHIDIFKVGLQLFSREGVGVVKAILAKKKRVFLDLKFHDIPHTVSNAVRAAAIPGVEFLTIHASGGIGMMSAAVSALRECRSQTPTLSTRLLAVTVLTSLDETDLRQIGIAHSPAGQVMNLGRLAKECKVDGMVTSPYEVRLLRAELGSDLVFVTPGIRLANGETQDQKRIMTPATAIQEGSNFLVMGRSLLDAPKPLETLQKILEQIQPQAKI